MGPEDPVGREMATPSSILAWEIPWTEEPGELQSRGSQKDWTGPSDYATTTYVSETGADDIHWGKRAQGKEMSEQQLRAGH